MPDIPSSLPPPPQPTSNSNPTSTSASTPQPPPPSKMPPLPSTTLIVATTPILGIGLQNTLPWPHLKADLRFFARVTKRLPPLPRPSPHHTTSSSGVKRSRVNGTGGKKRMNAVMMGRKTWESLPEKVRPLGGRVNVVLSRQQRERGEEVGGEEGGEGEGGEVCVRAGGVEEGLGILRSMGMGMGMGRGKEEGGREEEGDGEGGGIEIGRVFVIGGAEIYKAVLEGGWAERILWTRLSKEWECDTWFPSGVLPGGKKEEEVVEAGWGRWVKRSTEEMERWVGESGVGGLRTEGDVEFEVMMWERERERDGEEGMGG